MAGLSPDEKLRYQRQIQIPEVGPEGQARLKEARVLVVGAGGLGCPLSLYLAAAGVGTIGLVDFDAVDLTNLQRQVLYSTESVGRPKLSEARARLSALNPHVRLECHDTRLSADNALELVRGYDVVADGSDNFPTRYLVNDAAVLAGKPNVFGSVFRFEGQVAVFWARRGPCYRCLYPEPPPPEAAPSCAQAGVFGLLPGIVGCLQAAETLKLLLGIGSPLVGRLVHFDALSMEWRSLAVAKDPACRLCGPKADIRAPVATDSRCAPSEEPPEVEPDELRARLERCEAVLVIDVREPRERELGVIEGSVSIPLGQLAQRAAGLPRDRDIVLHCQSGRRSARAVELLRERGFTRVAHLAGGLDAWKAI
ncbi:MAG: molybdopterin-synthase adenylyltransferase MoeB [Elusimicrobia bacterium]|nr:molybdopterin-synthase adenylyltransferase MoeB [Elusimicrobiota bacterium]